MVPVFRKILAEPFYLFEVDSSFTVIAVEKRNQEVQIAGVQPDPGSGVVAFFVLDRPGDERIEEIPPARIEFDPAFERSLAVIDIAVRIEAPSGIICRVIVSPEIFRGI
ncbi:hypothetical protein SDC9_178763 [bioreactor metagenome]|uniref:Uncharacterized protein n=1 Tax=bioreactor metagenome TaxID=1076179 RepID=A0A645GZX5_9ZZZZ